MIIGIPRQGDYIVITHRVTADTNGGYQNLTWSGRAENSGRYIHAKIPINFEVGEWYLINRIVSGTRLQSGYPTLSLTIGRSKKGRVWMKNKLIDLLEANYPEYVGIVRVRDRNLYSPSNFLNGKAEIVSSEADARNYRERLLEEITPKEKTSRWSLLQTDEYE